MLLRLASSNLSLEVAPHQQVLWFVPSNIAFQYPIWLLLVDVRGVTRYAIQIQENQDMVKLEAIQLQAQ